jgi:hypothetical protein
VRRRIARHPLRHAHAVEMSRERCFAARAPLPALSRRPRHHTGVSAWDRQHRDHPCGPRGARPVDPGQHQARDPPPNCALDHACLEASAVPQPRGAAHVLEPEAQCSPKRPRNSSQWISETLVRAFLRAMRTTRHRARGREVGARTNAGSIFPALLWAARIAATGLTAAPHNRTIVFVMIRRWARAALAFSSRSLPRCDEPRRSRVP